MTLLIRASCAFFLFIYFFIYLFILLPVQMSLQTKGTVGATGECSRMSTRPKAAVLLGKVSRLSDRNDVEMNLQNKIKAFIKHFYSNEASNSSDYGN